jgi:bifunctional UDP-N-acetylglucosamine pyrophosphorylase/glucosamine-1-phosphate N-acetyltransferase/UDP-N-acetylglucosamine pyrophosphorylase
MGSVSSIPQHCAAVILAAGLGKRMKSNKAKVLHELRGRPMICHVAQTARRVVGGDIVVVVGHQADRVKDTVAQEVPARFALQKEQLGTGHAVACAMEQIDDDIERVVVLYGDVPLLRPDTIADLIDDHVQQQRDLTVLAVEMDDPTGYGRVLHDDRGRFVGIVEEADASSAQKAIRIINTGIYCIQKDFLCAALPKIRCNNAQGEYYLTDVVAIGYAEGRGIGVQIALDADEVVGVNSLADLRRADTLLSARMDAACG